MECVCGYNDETGDKKFRNIKVLYKEVTQEIEGQPHNKAVDYIWELDTYVCPKCGTLKSKGK